MFTLPFSEIHSTDVELVGGKGASLGELTNCGVLVPPGYVVTTEAFHNFLNQNHITNQIEQLLKKTRPDDVGSTTLTSVRIRNLIESATISKSMRDVIYEAFAVLNNRVVAVRSSATTEDSQNASWAGELDSFLNVTKRQILISVKRCWSSLFTPRAIAYRFEHGLEKERIGVGVVVQQMIDSEVSGTCFSVDPVTRDQNLLVIEAVYGLGEGIVSGLITPDRYLIHVKNRHVVILDKTVSMQIKAIAGERRGGTNQVNINKENQSLPKLTDGLIIELASECKGIENYYGYPQDIEWALKNEKVYILQSRPITTLPKQRRI